MSIATKRAASVAEMHRVHEEHVAAENQGDLEAAMRTYHEDCFYENVPLGTRAVGRDGILSYYTALRDGIPDGLLDIEHEAYGENTLISWGTFTGTVSGSLFGLEPTNRRVSFPVVALVSFKDGLMSGERLMYDLVTLAEQAGYPLERIGEVARTIRSLVEEAR